MDAIDNSPREAAAGSPMGDTRAHSPGSPLSEAFAAALNRSNIQQDVVINFLRSFDSDDDGVITIDEMRDALKLWLSTELGAACDLCPLLLCLILRQ